MLWLILMGVVVLLAVVWVAVEEWADKEVEQRKSGGGGKPDKYQV